jgi:glycosyltransferase involved in cell wall biosynthesis
VLRLSHAPVTLYTTHDHWLVCPMHVLWKYRTRPCERPQCFSCSIVSGIPPQLWRYTKLLERSLEHVDAILAPSQFIANKHREAGIRRPIHVLNSFSTPLADDCNVRSISDDPAGAIPGRTDKPVFVYAGRVELSKGLEQLLEAFRQRPAYELLIAGDGSIAGRLRRQYADCTHIRFLGTVPHRHVATLFRDAVAVISPTWGPEAFTLVNIEAMSCSTPVIARRAGGSVEAIERCGGGLSTSNRRNC